MIESYLAPILEYLGIGLVPLLLIVLIIIICFKGD